MPQSLSLMNQVSPALVALVSILLASDRARAADVAAADGVSVSVETTAGGTETGLLESIDGELVRLAGASGQGAFPIASVRTVTRQGSAPREASEVQITCVDGGRLSGADVAWEGDTVTLSTSAGPIRLPVARVRTLVWNGRSGETPADGSPGWLQTLPESPDADIVVVAKGDDVQFVACAITGISADKVTVILDGETIPVNRERVVGLHWLREPIQGGGIIVAVSGGRLPASRVGWSPKGLTVDDVILPASALRSIDYAAARTVRLAALEPERLTVEPFFGGLAEIEGVTDYFRPRAVADRDSSRQDLVVRPRTVAVWRVPPGSRSFSTAVSLAAAAGAGGSLLSIAVDEREVYRASVDRHATGGDGRITIDAIPLDNARRLSIAVDYGSAGPAGGSVVLHDPIFTR